MQNVVSWSPSMTVFLERNNMCRLTLLLKKYLQTWHWNFVSFNSLLSVTAYYFRFLSMKQMVMLENSDIVVFRVLLLWCLVFFPYVSVTEIFQKMSLLLAFLLAVCVSILWHLSSVASWFQHGCCSLLYFHIFYLTLCRTCGFP